MSLVLSYYVSNKIESDYQRYICRYEIRGHIVVLFNGTVKIPTDQIEFIFSYLHTDYTIHLIIVFHITSYLFLMIFLNNHVNFFVVFAYFKLFYLNMFLFSKFLNILRQISFWIVELFEPPVNLFYKCQTYHLERKQEF